MYWPDGTEVTSADVKFGWEVDRDGTPLPHTCETDGVCRVDTPDRYTAVYHLPQPRSSFLDNIPGYVLPAKWAGFWNHDVHAAAVALNTNLPPGSPGFPSAGPYQTLRFVGDRRAIMGPMPHYTTLTCGGHIQKLVFVQYASVAELVAAAATHQVDITAGQPGFFPGPTASDVPLLEQHTDSYTLWIGPGSFYLRLSLMVDRTYHGQPNPLADTRVRLALALGLDRDGLVRKALDLNRQEIQNLISWTPWPNTPVLRAPGADRSITGQWDPLAGRFLSTTGRGRALADAHALLASTPWAHGFTLDLFTTNGNPARYAAAQYLARSWARLGVHVNLNFVSGADLFNDWDHGGIVAHGAFQVGLWAESFLDDGSSLDTSLQSRYIQTESSHNATTTGDTSHIRDAVIDRDVDLLARTTKRKARDTLLAAIQQQLNRKAYWIMLWIQPNIATSDDRVADFAPGLAPLNYDIQNWRVTGP
jgi:ABC-type transport system substrate-binding protein